MSRTARTDDKRAARDVILDAVESLLADPATARITIDAAARASGFSKGGVLYNFPTKDAVLLATGSVPRRLPFEAGRAGVHVLRSVADARALRAEVEARRAGLGRYDSPTLAAMIETHRSWAPTKHSLARALIAALIENDALRGPIDALFADLRARILAEAARPRRAMAVWAALEGLHFAVSLRSVAFPPEEGDGLLDELLTLLEA